LTLIVKTGSVVMSLIEKKYRLCFTDVNPEKRYTPVARNFSRHDRHETSTLFKTGPALIFRPLWCYYKFPEIKNSETEPLET
jgi:hypothetical protein